MWHYGYGWDFFPGGILWVLFWILIASFFWGRGRRWHNHGDKEKSAEDVLADRFAKGEIDEEEYTKRLQVLRKHAK